MLKIGITGGIGSGKSTVSRLFALLGIPVYDADSRARLLMTTNKKLVASIKKSFGNTVYDAKGNLNRPLLASMVFNNPEKLELLNSLVHPAVQLDYTQWHNRQKNQPYTLKEAALLFESGSYKHLDAVILVSAPDELRITRAMQRDGVKREAIVNRIKNQMSEAQRKKLSDYFILNDEQHPLIEQVMQLHARLA